MKPLLFVLLFQLTLLPKEDTVQKRLEPSRLHLYTSNCPQGAEGLAQLLKQKSQASLPLGHCQEQALLPGENLALIGSGWVPAISEPITVMRRVPSSNKGPPLEEGRANGKGVAWALAFHFRPPGARSRRDVQRKGCLGGCLFTQQAGQLLRS